MSAIQMPPARFAFVADPLDRSDALRDDPRALRAWWPYASVIALDADGRALADEDGNLQAFAGLSLERRAPALHDEAIFLGIAQGDDAPGGRRGWFAVAVDGAAGSVGLEAPRRMDLRAAATQWPARESTLFAQARALLHWHARNRHCGACGSELALRRGGWEAHCAGCGAHHYPRTDPAIIVAVTNGARLLLGRQPSWPAHRYSTLAGFVEPGESLEQTVAREVMEESGVRVRIDEVRYLASQPWPFPGSLMLGFIANAEPDEPQIGDELEDARWFTRDEVGAALRGEGGAGALQVSPWISISRWLIETWYAS